MKQNTPRYGKVQSLSSFLQKGGRFCLFALCLLLILSGCSENTLTQPVAKNKSGTKPLPVKIATVVRQNMPVELRSVGSAEAFASVEIRSQVSGVLEEIGFKEGDQIQAGDLLFRINSRPFVSKLEQARATLANDQASLENARKQADRYLPAAAKGYVSIEQSDQAQTNVASLEATIKADLAAIENANIDLDNCTIRSPLSGYSGELFADPGTLIEAAGQPLITINQTSPIKVSFTLPEQSLAELNKHLANGEMTVAVNSAGAPLTGKLTFLDNQVNQATGTIRLKAVFANQDRQLWPGQFVNVRLRLTTRKDAIIVPTRTIQASQTGDFIYVVKSDQTVEPRPVKVGFSVDDQSVIDAGLNIDEIVVTDGQLRLRPGSAIKVVTDPIADGTPQAAQ